jgi:hypothetical protein
MTAPTVLVLALSPDELRALLRAEVDAALATHSFAATKVPAARVTLDELSRLEACSYATVRRLVAEGAPVTYLGQSPRFDVEAFRAWLEERGRKGTQAKPSKGEAIPGVRLLSRARR